MERLEARGSVEVESRESTMSEEGSVVGATMTEGRNGSAPTWTAMGGPVLEEWGVGWAREPGTHEHSLEKKRLEWTAVAPQMPKINKKL